MKWTKKGLKILKNTVLAAGSIIILLYIILALIESTTKIISIIILLPIAVWPFIAMKNARQASIMATTIGAITIIWFIIDFVVLRAERVYWHIPLFLLIAPLPAFALGYLMWLYAEHMKKK
jgi:hypothetical protein